MIAEQRTFYSSAHQYMESTDSALDTESKNMICSCGWFWEQIFLNYQSLMPVPQRFEDWRKIKNPRISYQNKWSINFEGSTAIVEVM